MTKENTDQAQRWIELFNMQSHPEGGFYAETYRSNDHCQLDRLEKHDRSCGTAIYYLLQCPQSPRSLFHRIKADELWHFYAGSPLKIHILDEKSASHTEILLHNRLDVSNEARPQLVIRHGLWFAAELNIDNGDQYALCGCTCTPGFDFADFECAQRSDLLEKFPRFHDLIVRLTPVS